MSATTEPSIERSVDDRKVIPSETEGGLSRRRTPIADRYRVLRDVLRPGEWARGAPFEFVIEVTSRCNLKCPMCPRELIDSLGNRDMDMDTFAVALQRIRHLASFVWFAGLGEPLMNKHFLDMVKACHDAGLTTGASTNGTLLNARSQERILNSGLDLLIISFDGANKETYEKVRVGAHFEQVRENVIAFTERKTKRRSSTPWIILQMIELAHTLGQEEEFRRMWRIPGVDSIRLKKDELQFDESLGFDKQRKRTSKRPCPFLWRGAMYIHWNGFVSPCCYGAHDESFGNIRDVSAEALWNSRRVRQLRRTHLSGHGLEEPFCRNCEAYQPRKLPMAASTVLPCLLQKKHSGAAERLNHWLRFMG